MPVTQWTFYVFRDLCERCERALFKNRESHSNSPQLNIAPTPF